MNQTDRFQDDLEILAEFQVPDAELARQLLNLREIPSDSLRQRVRSIQFLERQAMQPSYHTLTRKHQRLALWAATCFTIMLALLLAFPGLRAVASEAVQRIFSGIFTADQGSVYTPAPPFAIKHPGYFPEGFILVAQQYNPATADPNSGDILPGMQVELGAVEGQLIDPSLREIALDDWAFANEPYIVLRYTTRDGQYVQLFERVTRIGEVLPQGLPYTVGNQVASLQNSRNSLKLVWFDNATRFELEGNISQNELFKIANGLVASPSTAAESTFFLQTRPFCDPAQEPPHGRLLGDVAGQQYKGSVWIQLFNRKNFPETVAFGTSASYGSTVPDPRTWLFEPALAALQDLTIAMQRLPYTSLDVFTSASLNACLEPDPSVQGYIAIEVWDGQVNLGYGGAGLELKARAIGALIREIEMQR